MKPFERYFKIKEELKGCSYNEAALSQYLHIAQVLAEEEKAYKRHREHMLQWLATIEQTIYQSAERARECLLQNEN